MFRFCSYRLVIVCGNRKDDKANKTKIEPCSIEETCFTVILKAVLMILKFNCFLVFDFLFIVPLYGPYTRELHVNMGLPALVDCQPRFFG
jgi:hypothetical protein